MRVQPYRFQIFILKHQNIEFCKIPRNLLNDVKNNSANSELSPRIQNYSAYSELLRVFTIHKGEPKGEPGMSHIYTARGASSVRITH